MSLFCIILRLLSTENTLPLSLNIGFVSFLTLGDGTLFTTSFRALKLRFLVI